MRVSTQSRRMKANKAAPSGYSAGYHQVEHYEAFTCASEPPCEPIGEPYIIRAGDFDPERQERQSYWSDNVWTREGAMTAHAEQPIIVRDKPKRKTLEEALVTFLTSPAIIEIRAPGSLEDATRSLANELRQAFPELKDK